VAGALGALTVTVRFQYAPLIGMILRAGGTRARVKGWLAMIGGGDAGVCGRHCQCNSLLE